MSFPNVLDGFMVGAPVSQSGLPPTTGQLLSTHDGGATWSSLPLPCTGQDPGGMALDFVTPRDGWLMCGGQPGAGQQGKSLLQTQDGGLHWTTIASTGPGWTSGSLLIDGYVDSVFFTNPLTGYIGLQRGGLLVSHDGGKTWSEVFSTVVPDGSDFGYSIGFLRGGFGWLLGGESPALYTTPDGGAVWKQTYPPALPTGDITMLPGGQAFAVSTWGNQPTLVGSSDAGGTWAAMAQFGTPYSGITALQVLSSDVFVQAYQDVLSMTQNAGAHWEDVTMPSGWFPIGLGFEGPGLGWVVAEDTLTGGSHALFSCTGVTCRALHTPFAPSAALETGPNAGFAVGADSSGRYGLFTTADGGLNWTQSLLPAGFDPVGVGENRHVTWIYAQSAFLWSYTGTSAWHEVLLGASETITSLSLQGYEDALMTTGRATGPAVWRSTDGGEIFRAVP